jgi:hypothetical protein
MTAHDPFRAALVALAEQWDKEVPKPQFMESRHARASAQAGGSAYRGPPR